MSEPEYGYFKCPMCKIGDIKLVPGTLENEEPLNKCTYCDSVFKIFLEDDNEEQEYLRFELITKGK